MSALAGVVVQIRTASGLAYVRMRGGTGESDNPYLPDGLIYGIDELGEVRPVLVDASGKPITTRTVGEVQTVDGEVTANQPTGASYRVSPLDLPSDLGVAGIIHKCAKCTDPTSAGAIGARTLVAAMGASITTRLVYATIQVYNAASDDALRIYEADNTVVDFLPEIFIKQNIPQAYNFFLPAYKSATAANKALVMESASANTVVSYMSWAYGI